MDLLPHQIEPTEDARQNLADGWWIVGGRGTGKTTGALKWAYDRAIESEAEVAYVSPVHGHSLFAAIEMLGLLGVPADSYVVSTSRNSISFEQGGSIVFYGSHHPGAVRGKSIAGSVVDNLDDIPHLISYTEPSDVNPDKLLVKWREPDPKLGDVDPRLPLLEALRHATIVEHSGSTIGMVITSLEVDPTMSLVAQVTHDIVLTTRTRP